MSMGIDGVWGRQFGGYVSLADFQDNFRRAELVPSREVVQDVSGSANPRIVAERQDDRSMTRYIDAPNGALTHRETFARTEAFVRKYRLASGNKLPEDADADLFESADKIAKHVFGPAQLERCSVISEKAVILAKLLEAKVLAGRPREEGQPEPSLSGEERQELVDICRTAIEKTLQTADVRAKFLVKPAGHACAAQVLFHQQLLQLELDALARAKADRSLSSAELRERLDKVVGRLCTISENGKLVPVGLRDACLNNEQSLVNQIAYLRGGDLPKPAPVPVDDNVRAFGDVILNGALGLAELLYRKEISEDAIVTFANQGGVYSLENTADVIRMQYESMQFAKEVFTQEKELTAFLAALEKEYAASQDHREGFLAAKEQILKIIQARKMYTRVLDFEPKDRFIEIRQEDGTVLRVPDEEYRLKQLADMRERMTQFRFDLQWHAGQVGTEEGNSKIGYGGVMERIRRGFSNWRADNKHKDQRYASTGESEKAFKAMRKLEKDNVGLLSAFMDFRPGKTPLLASKRPMDTEYNMQYRIAVAAHVAHTANGGVRNHEADGVHGKAWTKYANDVLDLLGDGGTRTFVTSVSVSALMKAKVPGIGEAKVGLTGSRKAAVALSHKKGGVYELEILTKYGVRGGGELNALDEKLKADGGVALELGEGSKLTFRTRKELLAFLRKNAPELMREVPGAMTFGSKPVQESLRLTAPTLTKEAGYATKAFRAILSALKFRIHKTKHFNEVEFNHRMHKLGAFNGLQKIEYRRQNAVAATLQERMVVGGSVDGSVSVGGEEKTVGDQKVKTDPRRAGKAKIAASGDILTLNYRLKSAQDRFRHYSSAEMRELVFRKEMNLFVGDSEAKGLSWYNLPSTKNTFRNAVRGTEERLRKFVESACDPKLANPRDRVVALRREFESLRREVETYCGKVESAASKFEGDAQSQAIYALRLRAYAVTNELFAKTAEELRDDPNAGKAERDEAAAIAQEARGVVAPGLDRPAIELDETIMQKFVQFSTERDGTNVLKIEGEATYSWDRTPSSTVTSTKAPETPLDALGQYFSGLPEKLRNDLFDLAKGVTFQKGSASVNVLYKRPLHDDPTQPPWTQHGELSLSVKLDTPANYIAFLIAAGRAIHSMKTKIASDPAAVEGDCDVADRALESLAGQVVNAMTLDAERMANGALLTPLKSLFAGGGASLGFLKPILEPKSTTESSVKVNFTLTDGVPTSLTVVDAFKRISTLKAGVSVPLVGFGVEIRKTEEDGIEKTLVEFIGTPPISHLLGRCAGLEAAKASEKKDAMEAFFRRHQGCANDTVKDLRDVDGIRRVGPDRKGGTVGGIHRPSTTRLRQIANVRRDMEKLLLIADSKAPSVSRPMRDEARRLYDELFSEEIGANDVKEGIWSRILDKPAEGEKDGDRNALLAELMTKVTAAYAFILDTGDLVEAYGSAGDLDLSNTNPVLTEAFERNFVSRREVEVEMTGGEVELDESELAEIEAAKARDVARQPEARAAEEPEAVPGGADQPSPEEMETRARYRNLAESCRGQYPAFNLDEACKSVRFPANTKPSLSETYAKALGRFWASKYLETHRGSEPLKSVGLSEASLVAYLENEFGTLLVERRQNLDWNDLSATCGQRADSLLADILSLRRLRSEGVAPGDFSPADPGFSVGDRRCPTGIGAGGRIPGRSMFGQTRGGNTCGLVATLNAMLAAGGEYADKVNALLLKRHDDERNDDYYEIGGEKVYVREMDAELQSVDEKNRQLLEHYPDRPRISGFSEFERAFFVALNRKQPGNYPIGLPLEYAIVSDVISGNAVIVDGGFGAGDSAGEVLVWKMAEKARESLSHEPPQPVVLLENGHYVAVVGVKGDGLGGLKLQVVESVVNGPDGNELPPEVRDLPLAELAKKQEVAVYIPKL